ncbi:MAG: hydantoinase B/oxoprolinase family protein, partial [Candidatus Methylomirabilales bacterium]
MGHDTGKLAAVREGLAQVLERMEDLWSRASCSRPIARLRWRACGFYGLRQGEMLGSGPASQPFLAEVASNAAGDLLRFVGGEGRAFGAGDLYLGNDPRVGGGGLDDLCFLAPAFAEGTLVGLLGMAGSYPTVSRGGIRLAPDLRHEGTVIPWIRIRAAGKPVPEVLGILGENLGLAEAFAGEVELIARILAAGEEGIAALCAQYGREACLAAFDALRAGCEAGLDRLLARLPEGPPKDPLPVPVAAYRDGGRIVLDATGLPRAGLQPVPRALSLAALRLAVKEVFHPEVPALPGVGGWEAGWEIRLPPDAWAAGGAVPAAAGRFLAAQAIADAAVGAFAEVFPHLAHAPGPTALGQLDLQGDREDGSRYAARLLLGGGAGASVWGDGLHHTTPLVDPGTLRPLEEIEEEFPVRFLRFALREDSAGPGQYRGGAGAVLTLTLTEGSAEARAVVAGAARGLRGGLRGTAGQLLLETPSRGEQTWEGPATVTLSLAAGDRLTLEAPGGAGWGIPYRRSIMRVEEDVAAGLVSRQAARRQYGVVFDTAGAKDDVLTYRLRKYLLNTLAIEDLVAGESLLD